MGIRKVSLSRLFQRVTIVGLSSILIVSAFGVSDATTKESSTYSNLRFGASVAESNSTTAVASDYKLTTSPGTYTSISGTNLTQNVTTGYYYTGAMPSSFTFPFNGVTYSNYAICKNGWVLLYNGSLPTTGSCSSTPLTATGSGYNNIVAALGTPLAPKTGTVTGNVRASVVGTSPSFRKLIIQWQNFQRTTNSADQFSFQIILEEITGLVQITYDISAVASSDLATQVGLRGAGNDAIFVTNTKDQSGNPTLTTWDSAIALTTSASMMLSAVNNPPGKPSSGLTYQFKPICLTNTWLGRTDIAWDNSNNWSCGELPNESQSVTINASSYNPTITGNVKVKALNASANSTVTVASNSTLTLSDSNGNGSSVVDGQLVVNGALIVGNPTSGSSLTVRSGGNLFLNGGSLSVGSAGTNGQGLNVNSGGTFALQNGSTLTTGQVNNLGNFTVSGSELIVLSGSNSTWKSTGTFTCPSCKLRVDGSGALQSSSNFYNLEISPSSTFDAKNFPLTVSGSFTNNLGAFTPSSDTTNGNTFNGAVINAGTWSGTTGKQSFNGSFSNQSGARFDVSGEANFIGQANNNGAWNSNPASVQAFTNDFTNNGTFTLSDGSITYNGDFTNNLNKTYIVNAGDVYIKGNWVNNGSLLASGGTVHFVGSDSQQIQGTTSTSYDSSFMNVEINKPAAAGKTNAPGIVSLIGNVFIDGSLALNGGQVVLGDYNLVFNKDASINGFSGSEDNMIITDGNGELRKVFAGTGSFLYPIGDNATIPGDATPGVNYAPIIVNVLGGSNLGMNPYIGLRTIDTRNGYVPTTATPILGRYWTIHGTITDPLYNAAFTFNSGDIIGSGAIYGRKCSTPPNCVWQKMGPAVGSTFEGDNLTSFSEVTGFGDGTLAATLSEFNAFPISNEIQIGWETSSELGNVGFNLWRGTTSSEPDVKLNNTLIPSEAPGSSQGFSYIWHDNTNLIDGSTYYYWLEDVDINGIATRHGPISTTYLRPTSVKISGTFASSDNSLSYGIFAAFGIVVGCGFLVLQKRNKSKVSSTTSTR